MTGCIPTGVQRFPREKYHRQSLAYLAYQSGYMGVSIITMFGKLLETEAIFTARCYASAVLAMGLCLSQVGVLLKRLNRGSQKQHHTIAQGL